MNELEQLRALKAQYDVDKDIAKYNAAVRPILDKIGQSGNPTLIAQATMFSPQIIQAAETSANKEEYLQKVQQMGGILQGAVDLTQLGMAYDQIRTANSAARQTAMPQPPQTPWLNPQLTEAIYNAQRQAGDISYAIDPAKQQIQQAYTQALGQAQSVTGGQASNYQALANLANQQRMQAAVNLVPIGQQARMENQGVSNQLLGQRIQEQQNQFNNQLYSYQPHYEQFNNKQQAIGALGSQGRTNAFDVISRLPEYLNYLPFDEQSNNFIKNARIKTDERLRNRQTVENRMSQRPSAFQDMQYAFERRRPFDPTDF